MLIRIAPDMFVDERFDCVKVQEVREEIFRTQRFKTRYPWRMRFKDKIIPFSSLRNTGDDYLLHLAVIEKILDAGCLSSKSRRSIGLSFVDKRVAAYVTTYDLGVSSTDNGLIDFLEQEFGKKNRSPLISAFPQQITV